MKKFSLVLAAAVAALAPQIALAKPPMQQRGYQADVRPSGRVCIRPTTSAEVARLGIPLGQKRCKFPRSWAWEGLHVEVRQTQPA